MKLFKLLSDLIDVGVTLNFSDDFGPNTFTVDVTYTAKVFPFGKMVDGEMTTVYESSTHFHSGFPDCTPEQGEAELIKRLEQILHTVCEYRSNG